MNLQSQLNSKSNVIFVFLHHCQLRERESVFGGCHCTWRVKNEIRECVERIEGSKSCIGIKSKEDHW